MNINYISTVRKSSLGVLLTPALPREEGRAEEGRGGGIGGGRGGGTGGKNAISM